MCDLQPTAAAPLAISTKPMNYQQQLNPWVISKLLPNLKHLTVSRFRRRTEAEAYLKLLQQHQPQAHFAIMFDVGQGEYATQGES